MYTNDAASEKPTDANRPKADSSPTSPQATPRTRDDDTDDEKPAWTPGENGEATKQCQSCDRHVTKQFARVFGNNQNEVFGCTGCMTASAIKRRGTLEDCDGDVADGFQGSDLYGGV